MTGAEVGLTTEEYLDECGIADRPATQVSVSVLLDRWTSNHREAVVQRWLSIGAPDGCTEVTW